MVLRRRFDRLSSFAYHAIRCGVSAWVAWAGRAPAARSYHPAHDAVRISMHATLKQLCDTLSKYGMTPELRGDPQRVIHSVATLEDARDGEITFLSNPKYEKALQTTKASAVVLKPAAPAPDHLDLIRVEDPY